MEHIKMFPTCMCYVNMSQTVLNGFSSKYGCGFK